MAPRATWKAEPNCGTRLADKQLIIRIFRLIQDSERYCPNRQIY